MRTKADFYVENDKNELSWVGSLYDNGEPWNIPAEILIQVNPVMFEELTLDHLRKNKSAIAWEDRWPWEWPTSESTDYTYILCADGNLIAYSSEEKTAFDPLMIAQGEDMHNARNFKIVVFPKMRKNA